MRVNPIVFTKRDDSLDVKSVAYYEDFTSNAVKYTFTSCTTRFYPLIKAINIDAFLKGRSHFEDFSKLFQPFETADVTNIHTKKKNVTT